MFDEKDVIEINRMVGETGKLLNPSSLTSAFSSSDYVDQPELKLAYIVRSVMQNHPFVDGNKRTGCVLLISGLDVLGMKVRKTDAQIVKFAVTSVVERWTPQQILNWAVGEI